MIGRSGYRVIGIAAILVVSVSVSVFAQTPKLNLRMTHFTPREQEELQQVGRLTKQYDLKKYTKTRDIIIEQGALAHAYPTLTMNCRFRDNDDLALSQYVHEQGHWAVHPGTQPRDPRLLSDLLQLAPGLPTQYPAGGGDVLSTYNHIPVLVLEWQALEDLIGPERARKVLEWKAKDHYTATYSFVLEHRAEVEDLMRKYDIHW